MLANYDASLKRVLVHEGGYSNHPADPGGATMKGVIQRVYDAYRRRRQLPTQSVKAISDAEIAEIYRTQYADKISFNSLPTGVDYVVFDGAVNSGPGQSVKWLQRALGVKADGVIGAVTIDAAENFPNKAALVNAICDQRLKFLKQLKTWPTFGKGWASRVASVRADGKQMAMGGSGPARLIADAKGAAKAPVADINKPSAPVGGPTAGAGAGVLAATLQSAKETLEPLLGTSTTVANLYTYLTVALAGLAIAGMAYGFWAAHRRAKVKDAIGVVT